MKKKLLIVTTLLVVAGAAVLGPALAHHFLPLSWTGEAVRLADVLGVRAGDHIAEIGAGGGAMARELAKVVGPQGRLIATEISADRRRELEALAQQDGLAQLAVREAHERGTNLPDACCSAIYMRNVLHHIDGWEDYGRDLARSLRPGGILVVIDFGPGAMFHLAGDHGADPDRVVAAVAQSGLRVDRRVDDWGGRTYLLAFRKP